MIGETPLSKLRSPTGVLSTWALWVVGAVVCAAIVAAPVSGHAGSPAARMYLQATGGGPTPPNSAILIRGRVMSSNWTVTATAAGKKIPTVVAAWPGGASFSHNADRMWRVRPETGDWPAQKTVTLTVRDGAPVKFKVSIGTERDEVAPKPGVWGKPVVGTLGGPQRPYHSPPSTAVFRIPHPEVIEEHSPILKVEVEVTFENNGGKGVIPTHLRPGVAGEVVVRQTPGAIPVRVRIIDTAGNVAEVKLPQ